MLGAYNRIKATLLSIISISVLLFIACQKQSNSYHYNNYKLYLLASIVLCLTLLALHFFENYKITLKSNKTNRIITQQLQQTIQELEQVNKTHEKILQAMTHDLRNPICGINGLVNILLDDEHSHETTHTLHLIKNTSNHTMLMVDDLAKSIFTEDPKKLSLQKTDIAMVLSDCVKLIEFRAKEKNQEIIYEMPEMQMNVMGQKENIWRVFTNLLVNAIKFSHRNGTIRVSVEDKDQNIEIRISDNGIGIAPHKQKIVFDIFTEAKRDGTYGEKPFGLGLSISKNIIEAHQGKIWLKSEENIGTTFYIELPKA